MDICYLCKSDDQDEIKYGEFMIHGDISVHYFCLLLSSNLTQNGKDDEGILGFLPRDIKLEESRVSSLICCYCQRPNANISCCASRCYKSFHLTCGEKYSTEHHFVGTFQSFCHRHVKGKKITPPSRDEQCSICYDDLYTSLGRFDTVKMIKAPCCKNGWFHKYCLAAFANSAGYFFKCPLCNDSKVFRQRLAYKGIFIPDRDAAWELEPNAFSELLERPNSCSAIQCNAEKGRISENEQNAFIFCETCGSVAIHEKCMAVQGEDFVCDECMSLTGKIKTATIVNITARDLKLSEQEEEDEEIDVGNHLDLNSFSFSETNTEFEMLESNKTVRPLMSISKIKENNDDIKNKTTHKAKTSDCCANNESDADKGISKRQRKICKQFNFNADASDIELDVISDNDNGLIACRRGKRVISCDVEGLFDSGAESDRSNSSDNKSNSNSSINLSRFECCTSNFTEKHVRSVAEKNSNETSSLGKAQHTCLDKCISGRWQNVKKSFKTELFSWKTDAQSDNSFDFKTVSHQDLEEPNVSPIRFTSHQLNEKVEPTLKFSPMRSRSRSEDISKRNTQLSRQRSFTPSLNKFGANNNLKRTNNSLESLVSNKRTRLSCSSGNEPYALPSKYESEKIPSLYGDEMCLKITEVNERPSKKCPPKFMSIFDIYAFMTPPYVQKMKKIIDIPNIPQSNDLKCTKQEFSPNLKTKSKSGQAVTEASCESNSNDHCKMKRTQ